MAIARTMKRHDTADPITGIASSGSGPVDLTVYTTVNFWAKTATGTVVGGEVTDANADGTFVYEPTAGDVGTEGMYDMELECITASGKPVTFPNAKAANPQLQIDEDLNDA
jgi:hypothetical protein